MGGTAGGHRAGGSLLLLGLCFWMADWAAPNPVGNLTAESQTNSSITLSWTVPSGGNPTDYIYWVQWTGPFSTNETTNTANTKETTYTVENLKPGSLYNISVWTESNGQNSTAENISVATAPNHVQDLTVVRQSNDSITLTWTRPTGGDTEDYTYWVQWMGPGGTSETRNTANITYTVEGLEPGSLYTFSVWAELNGVNSSAQNISAATVPNPVENLTTVSQTPSSITLNWNISTDGDTTNYTYWVQWTGPGGTSETRNTTDTTYTADKLKPGSLYNFSVWTESNGLNSSAQNTSAATAPNPVENLMAVNQTNSSVTLNWSIPTGGDTTDYTYWVQWTGPSVTNETRKTANITYTADGLEPGSLYNFSVWAELHGLNSPIENTSAASGGSTWPPRSLTSSPAPVPNAVTSLRTQDPTNSSLTVFWGRPLGPPDPAYTYCVSWYLEGATPTPSCSSDDKVTLQGLDPGSVYSVTVRAERHSLQSEDRTVTGTTAPNGVLSLRNETQTNHSITLRWEAPPDPHSQHYTYQVQWVTGEHPQTQGETTETSYRVDGLEPGTPYSLRVWAERDKVASSHTTLAANTAPNPVAIASCTSAWGGYGLALSWACPRGGYEAFLLELGGQLHRENRSACDAAVAVGGLQPARAYEARVSTVWAGLVAPGGSATCHTSSAGVIAGSILGVLLFLVLVGLLLFFLWRRRQRETHPAAKNEVFSFHKEVPADQFPEYVREKEKDSNWGFAEEYQILDQEDQNRQPQTVAMAPENQSKNRYKNVLPYDWSRVPLKPLPGEPGSDYINASFIPGLWKAQEFIATQGPLPQTVGDFWRLVWEQQSHTLVMLTNCMESGRVKCEHYWPLDATPCTHGHLQVTLEKEEKKDNWTIRDLKLRHTQEQKTLQVRQFHYLAWPDHGVPPSADPVLAFRKVVRERLDQCSGDGTPIVHCSAGVGRTGTLIALDVLLRQLEGGDSVGPFSFVQRMRSSRPLMVQTEAQYVFLHHCLLRFLEQSGIHDKAKEHLYDDLIYENIGAF
ncbi:receptor-type tyrosine-protein phosphatase H [Suncus etruscus]|uniref:receptor-type tyrosine-protein phosphatase H n=1 Tax=Suncus etruscus TaxID=109475 RepID=UPI0021103079|nr:receptor-type tyrosine-protein phosphatase H [Suncus etruscus]